MKLRLHEIVSLVVLGGASLLPPAMATLAKGFPTRQITLVVPYSAGGSTDMIAREYANRLGKELSQAVVVENRPGAATNIGGAAVAKANPDGYTLLFGGNGLIVNPIFGPKPSFNGARDFAPVSSIAETPFIVTANPNSAFSNPKELVKQAAAKPGSVSISSAQFHLYVELLKKRANIDLLHVPYKGGAQSVTDAIAGQVDTVISLIPVVLPYIVGKTLKPIAVSSKERVDILPDVPTFKESGINYNVTIWYGVFAPKGTPDEVIERLAEATQKVAASKDLADKLSASGARLRASTPQELANLITTQQAEWEEVAKALPELIITQGVQ